MDSFYTAALGKMVDVMMDMCYNAVTFLSIYGILLFFMVLK
jgi:hypothetical protein